MHKLLLLLCGLFSLLAQPLSAQQTTPFCGADYFREKALQDPDIFQKYQSYEAQILDVFRNRQNTALQKGSLLDLKIIPTVVHIIHDGGPENISDAQAQQAIEWLNQALSNAGYFNQGSGTDCGIQLCLAQRTPDNQPTNGITRNQSALTEMTLETQDVQVKNLNRWNPKDYLNIWVVRSICSNSYGCNIYGYSYYPYLHGSDLDGIVIEAAYVTQVEKIGGLAHETGHYFGLYHTFEGGCLNNDCLLDGDRICDTPPDQSTAAVPCGQATNTCSTDAQSGPFSSDQPDMTWNFMDYGTLACFHDFTPDQSTRMNASIEGPRHSLLDSKGCLPPCPGITSASFTPSATTINVGESVTFTNNSQNAGGYSWLINGTPFSTQDNPTYTFPNQGFYTITLNASAQNPLLCEPATTQVVIQVVCDANAAFSVSNLAPEEMQTIYITNTSQNALQMEWFVDGVSQGSMLDSLIFNTPGEYEIKLVVSNGNCEDVMSTLIQVQEICTQKSFESSIGVPYPFAHGNSLAVLANGDIICGAGGAPTSALFFDGVPVLVKLKPDGQLVWTKQIETDSVDESKVIVRSTPDGGFVVLYYRMTTAGPLTGDSPVYVEKYTADGQPVWGHTILDDIGSIFQDMVVNPDGSIVICALNFLHKLDASGATVWTKHLGLNEYLERMAVFPGGGYVGIYATYLKRFDAAGNVLWARQLLYSSGNTMAFTDVIAAADGSIFVCGTLGTQSVLIKTSPAGDVIWSKSYRYTQSGSSTQFSSLTLSPEGHPVLVGRGNVKIAPPGPIVHYLILTETDTSGNINWIRHRTQLFDPQEIVTMPSGGYSVIGDSVNSLHILKTDQTGQTGACPEEPRNLNVLDILLLQSILDLPASDTSFVTKPENFPTTDLSWTQDTICAPVCLHLTEICHNNLDDDGDGLFDCLDPDCDCDADSCAPNENNVWYFGNRSGLDFNERPPIALSDGQTTATGFSSTICDAEGQLLLYTDGFNVFNRFHQVMLNGNIVPNNQVVHFTLIIPHPGNSSLYFVVVNYLGGQTYYSLVNMSLDNGNGAVVSGQKDILLGGITSGLAAVKSCSFDGYWLLMRTLENNSQFQAYRIDNNGINTTPVTSNSNESVQTIRQLKLSPTGLQVASAHVDASSPSVKRLALYDFDPATGLVSNPLIIKDLSGNDNVIGTEFSPNGRFLYGVTQEAGPSRLTQFDLNAGNAAAIQNSALQIATSANNGYGYPQLTPNGKIYFALYSNFAPLSFWLNVVHFPNKKGLDCLFESKGIALIKSINNGQGLCNAIASYFAVPDISFEANAPDTVCNLNVPLTYRLNRVICGLDSIVWTVENLNVSIDPQYQSADIRFLSAGTGLIIATAHSSCGVYADTLTVHAFEPFTKTLDLGPDLVVCQNGVFTFNAGSGFAQYLWNDGAADSVKTTLLPGKYWVTVWDQCGNAQTDSITVSVAPGTVLNVGPDIPQQCSGYSSNYQLPANFVSWQWSPADYLSCTNCATVTISPQISTSWTIVAQTAAGCISVDTLRAAIRDTLLFSLDTSICAGQTLALHGLSFPVDTTVHILLPATGAGCDTLLTVNILGVDNAQSGIDTTICPSALFDYFGVLLPPDTVAVFHFPTAFSCDSTVTVNVHSYPRLTLLLPMDTTIHIGASVSLKSGGQGPGMVDFVWSPPDGLSCVECLDPMVSPLDTVTYTLAVTDANGCTTTGSVTIRVNEECRVNVPNAFTPNGDGANDVFRPIADPCVRVIRLWRIFNRWGEPVFEQYNFTPLDPALGWDGMWNSKPHPSDVLVWVAEFEYFDGRIESRSGNVTLIR